MKRTVIIGMIALVLLIYTVPARAFDTVGRLGLGIDGGLSIPAGGDITADSSFGDYYDIGPAFGMHVRYGLIKEVTLETGLRYSFNKIKDDANGDPANEPYFVAPEVYLNGIVNLGSFFNNPDNIINPFVKAGVALVPWRVTDDGAGGDAVKLANDEEWKKTSFGLNFGAGLEVFATPDLSLYAEGRYLMVFSEDEDVFGNDFGNMGDLTINLGLTYYLPLSSH
ncbi:MAG: outer membrane beta-barrel protein [Candidatus Zixiibacteriota bacterium]